MSVRERLLFLFSVGARTTTHDATVFIAKACHTYHYLVVRTYEHTWFSVHMCALFQSESCDITL